MENRMAKTKKVYTYVGHVVKGGRKIGVVFTCEKELKGLDFETVYIDGYGATKRVPIEENA